MRDLITLFCLIHKTKTASAFAVQLDRTETFSVFKEQIVRQNQNRFKGIDPPQLRLWKVSLQIGDEDHPLHNSSNELDPMWRISKVFPTDPSEEEIHIYVDAIPMESLARVQERYTEREIRQCIQAIRGSAMQAQTQGEPRGVQTQAKFTVNGGGSGHKHGGL